MANHEGACGTVGDVNGDFLPQVLIKYYASEYEDLTILKLEGEDMGGNADKTLNAQKIIDYILGQKHIDESLIKSRTNLHVGIGCACLESDSEE